MTELRCRAILFDLDGTLVDSTACVETIWGRWAAKHGVPFDQLLEVSHGRRNVDVMREMAPHLDAEAETLAMDREEVEAREGIVAVPGALALLQTLKPHEWAVVTSAARELARARLEYAGLPQPEVLVAAEDVLEGKPNPEGYLKAAKLLGVPPGECVVVEDTPAGLLAGRAAGMRVLGIMTTYGEERLLGAECVPHFEDVRFVAV